MPYLTINGIEVKLTKSVPGLEIGGEPSRAVSGRSRSSERWRKRTWTIETGHLEPLEAGAVTGLLLGDGHHFPFTADRYSERGLGPVADNASTINTGAGAFGASGFLYVATTITFPVQLPPNWTIGVRHLESGTWVSYWINSAGQKWVNGARSDSTDTSTVLSVGSDGSVTLGNYTSPQFDELVCLPYLTPTTWPPIWDASGAPFAALPWVNMAGGIGSAVILGQLTNADVVNMIDSTGTPSTGYRLEFKIGEV
jgi:hypothetical protein